MRNVSYLLFLLLFIIFLFIELSYISIPFVFMLSVVLLAFFRTTVIFIMVFLGSLSLDALRVVDFGITPLFVFAAFLIIHLYERYFGSSDIAIIAFITLSATFIYTYVLSYSFINVIMTVLTLGVLFYLFQYLVKKGVL